MTTFRYERVRDLQAWSRGTPGEVREYPLSWLGEGPWVFVPGNVDELFKRIRDTYPARLPQVADILVGAQTSADRVFLLRPRRVSSRFVEVVKDGTTYRIERDILRPSLWDVQIQSYEQPIENAFMLFPYALKGERAILYSSRDMKKKYPRAWDYLSAHKPLLLGRDRGRTPRTEWYRYGRSQNLAKFADDKIVVQVLAERPRYGYDSRGLMMTGGGNGPYYFVRSKAGAEVSLLAVLAVLNHPLTEAMVRSRGSDFQGGYFSRKKAVLDEVVLPFDLVSESGRRLHSAVSEGVLRLVQSFSATDTLTERQLATRRRTRGAAERAIQLLVSEAFRLTQADLSGISQFLEDVQERDEE